MTYLFHNRRYGENAFFPFTFFSFLLLTVDNFSSISIIDAFFNRLIPKSNDELNQMVKDMNRDLNEIESSGNRGSKNQSWIFRKLLKAIWD